MAVLKFYRGLEAKYSSVTHADGIYFCTDSHKIMLNGEQYGGSSSKTVEDVTLDGSTLTIHYTDTSSEELDLSVLGGTYTSEIGDTELEMPSAVGGISKGTTVGDLNGKTINQMFDDLLFPTVNPTFTPPSATIKFTDYAATQEVGATGPTNSNFVTNFNKGQITLNSTKQADRAGNLISGNSFIYVGNDPETQALPATVAEGNTTFKYRAAYEAGPQPKDNKGNKYGSPLSAGTVDSSAITLNGTYPWYASTATAGTLTKQALIAWNATPGQMTTSRFVLQPHTSAAKQQIKVPRELTQMQMLNTVSNQMEVISFEDWTKTEADEDVNEISHHYYTYSYNGADRGSVTLIVKF